jgi:hypothetical protein
VVGRQRGAKEEAAAVAPASDCRTGWGRAAADDGWQPTVGTEGGDVGEDPAAGGWI